MKRKTPVNAVQPGATSVMKRSAVSHNPSGQPMPRYSHAQNTNSGGDAHNKGRRNYKGNYKFFDEAADRKVIRHTKATKP